MEIKIEYHPSDSDRSIESAPKGRRAATAASSGKDQRSLSTNNREKRAKEDRQQLSSSRQRENNRNGGRGEKVQSKRGTPEQGEEADSSKRHRATGAPLEQQLNAGYKELMEERIKLAVGATLLHEQLTFLRPPQFCRRQDMLAASLLEGYLLHVSRRAEMIRGSKLLTPPDVKVLAKHLDYASFVVQNPEDQWSKVTVGHLTYKNADIFAHWIHNPGQVHSNIQRLAKDFRMEYSLSERTRAVDRAVITFKISLDIPRAAEPATYNLFSRGYLDPIPGSQQELMQQLAAAETELKLARETTDKMDAINKEVERLKGIAMENVELKRNLQKAEREVKDLQEQVQELQDDSQVRELKNRIKELLTEKISWEHEKDRLIEESHQLQLDLNSAHNRSSFVNVSDLETIMKKMLPAHVLEAQAPKKDTDDSE